MREANTCAVGLLGTVLRAVWARLVKCRVPGQESRISAARGGARKGEEGFSEVNGSGGAALGEGVEEDVGVEGWGACDGGDGGDGGEEGAALFA